MLLQFPGARRIAIIGREGAGAGGFSPISLSPFAWYDPSDLTTLFQERTGASATTPAVVDGVVGSMLDKSGNGNHVVAPADAARPILRNSGALYWLEFDGSDDTLTDTWTSVPQPLSRVSALTILTIPGAGSPYIIGGVSYGCSMFFTQTNINLFSGSILTGPTVPTEDTNFVTTEVFDGANSKIAVDNGSYSTGDAGATGSTGVLFGSEHGGGSFAHCNLWGVVILEGVAADAEIAQLRTYLAAKQGRVL